MPSVFAVLMRHKTSATYESMQDVILHVDLASNLSGSGESNNRRPVNMSTSYDTGYSGTVVATDTTVRVFNLLTPHVGHG